AARGGETLDCHTDDGLGSGFVGDDFCKYTQKLLYFAILAGRGGSRFFPWSNSLSEDVGPGVGAGADRGALYDGRPVIRSSRQSSVGTPAKSASSLGSGGVAVALSARGVT